MNREKRNLALILFALGFAGVLSILTVELPLPEEAKAEIEQIFAPWQFKLLTLLNPTLLLTGAVIVGTFLYKKAGLAVPVLEKIIAKEPFQPLLPGLLKYGITGGVFTGLALSLFSYSLYPHLPEAFLELGEKLKPGMVTRLLYGGITEEILMRFGLMTFVVWIAAKIFRSLGPPAYWTGIAVSTLLFAVGHFPIVFMAVENPPPVLLLYILAGNAIGGLVFGWLYWKRGLESAILAHMMAHVVMVLGEGILA